MGWTDAEALPTPPWMRTHEPSPIPGWLRPIIDAVMHDMQQPRPVPVEVAWEHESENSGVLWFSETGQSGAGGYGIAYDSHTSAAQRLVGLAWYLQDQFFPESEDAWAQARPPCPGHPHPATPVVRDGALGGYAQPTAAPSPASASSRGDHDWSCSINV